MDIDWTKEIYEKFLENAILTDEEKEILYYRIIKHWPQVKQADELHISLSTLNRTLKKCKCKYDEVQKNKSLNLPLRKTQDSKNDDINLKF